jgi:enoyl-CoA hydratase
VFEAKRGLFPLGGSTVRLRRQIGYAAAMEMLLTARGYSAAESRDIGLIGRVVPDGQALPVALEIAAMINGNGPIAVEAILRSVWETDSLPEPEALALELQIGQPVFASEDSREGTKAFAEKRPANFQRK